MNKLKFKSQNYKNCFQKQNETKCESSGSEKRRVCFQSRQTTQAAKDTRLPPGGVVTLNGPIAIIVSAHGGTGGSKVKENCEKVKADAEAAKTAVLEATLQSDSMRKQHSGKVHTAR